MSATAAAPSPRLAAIHSPSLWTVLIAALAALIGLGMMLGPSVTIVVFGAVVVGGLILLRPDAATPITLGLIYSNAAVVAAQFHGAPYVIPIMLPALLLVPIGFRLFRRHQPLIITGAMPFVALYLVVQLMAALASNNLLGSMEELTLFLSQGFALYLLVTNALYSESLVRVAVWVVVLVGAVLAALAVTQQVTGDTSNTFLGFAQAGNSLIVEGGQDLLAVDELRKRAEGPIGEPNRFAQALTVLVPLALFRFWGERRLILRALALSSAAIISFGVMLTLSRGAALGFVALLISLVVLRYVGVRQLLLMAMAVVMLGVAEPTYIQRLLSLEDVGEAAAAPGQTEADPVIQQRANDILVAVLVFIEHPVLGVGPGRFADVYRENAPRVGGLPGNKDYQAHSLFPGIAAETGVPGVLVFATIMGVTLRELRRARQLLAASRPELASLVTGFLVAVLVYIGTSFALHLSYQRYFWVLMAAAGAAAYVAMREARGAQAAQEVAAHSPDDRRATLGDPVPAG